MEQVRSSWQVMYASIYALTMRYLEEQFVSNSSKARWRDLLRIVIEPVGHIMLWSFFNIVRYNSNNSGLSPQLFIMLGVIPWMFTLNCGSTVLKIINKNKNLLFFRQIKPIDLICAVLLSELGVLSLVFCGGLLLFSVLGINWHCPYPLYWLASLALYIITVAGFCLSFACLSFFLQPLTKLLKLLLRLLYLFSGIFFSAQMIPSDLRTVLLVNPLFQFIELSRDCFTETTSYGFSGDINYLLKTSIVSATSGLAIYLLLRKKMTTEIMEH